MIKKDIFEGFIHMFNVRYDQKYEKVLCNDVN